MRWLKLIVLLLLYSLFFVSALLLHLGASLFRLRRWRIISRLTRKFAAMLRILLNVKIVLEGGRDCLETGGHFIVSNHLGYLDGIVLGSIFPVIYVSKKEVKQWPLIGQWSVLIGTIFVDREKRERTLQVVEKIADKLRQETNVLLFPEGTSTNGEKVLPFQSAHFAAPLMARTAIVPVTLTYRRIDQEPLSGTNRDRVYWYGGMDFAPHLWNLLGLRLIEVSVKIHPRVETSHFQNNSGSRKQLSQACYNTIAGQDEASLLRRTSEPLMKLGSGG